VLDLLAMVFSLTYKEIGVKLNIGAETVAHYVNNIWPKMHVRSRSRPLPTPFRSLLKHFQNKLLILRRNLLIFNRLLFFKQHPPDLDCDV